MERFRKKAPLPRKDSLIIGRQPVIEAMRGGRSIDKILFQQGVSGESIGEIRKLAREYHIPIQQVPAEKLMALTRSNHQGVIAWVGLIRYQELQQVIDLVVGEGEIPLFIMLEGVTDVRNIGAIARSAWCCGAQAMIIPDKGVGALNEEAFKSAAGALEHIQVCRVSSLMKAVDTLHLNGIKVFAAEMAGAQPVYEASFKDPCCIVMGSEDKGIFPPLLKQCDANLSIPLSGRFDSLNVSVAAGIFLYEALKQRLHKS